jgi:DNA-binding NtrC family response regulator
MVDVRSTDALRPGTHAVPAALRVVALSGPDRGAELLLAKGTYLVGKDPAADLVLTDGAVSRRHLELSVRQDGIAIRDLGSKNGSFLDRARFSQVVVGAGAVITIGKTQLRLTAATAGTRLPSEADHFGALEGRSIAMREVYAVLERIGSSDAAVLIEGETGTGKELCAEAIFAHSRRRAGPFVVCDLASVNRALIESELFGHRRGAFTGADRDRLGAFAEAEGGALFLDEVGELELELQPRLLRAIERRKVKPVGDARYRSCDVRVIAATSRNLEAECKSGRFRADLFHRLAVLRVVLPPLRERKEDIPLLAARFSGAAGCAISPEAVSVLVEHTWPGNVRELRNVIERAASLATSVATSVADGPGRLITPGHLGLDEPFGDGAPGERFHAAKERLVAEWERDYLRGVLKSARGNVSQAAKAAGLNRQHLHHLMKKHGIAGG